MSGRKDIPSLIQLGYDPHHTEHWDEIQFDDKQDHLALIDERLKSFRKPDIQVRIGDAFFECHALLLRCYSETFDELENERVVVLPEEKVAPQAFQIIYDWMLSSKADIRREFFVEVFVAAEYLRIKHLVDQCWICMDSSEALMEDRAFLLYIEAARHQQSILKSMLLKRICTFFLPLVASYEFTQMPLDDLCMLLKSSYIGVFSETDVFYSACVWLLEDWDNRQEFVGEVINQVRFALISPSLLAQLNCLDADERIHDILRHETTKYLVAQALSYALSSKSFKQLDQQKPVNRTWIEDPNVSQDDIDLEKFSSLHNDYEYEMFLTKLQNLPKDRDCWKRWKRVEINIEPTDRSSSMLFQSSSEGVPH